MENRAHAFVAGLFVILLSAAAVTAIKWFSDENVTYNHHFLISEGGAVSGLNPEALVCYCGVNVGKVEDIYFDQKNMRNIIVRIAVSSNVTLPEDVYAQLSSQGITGLAYIELNDDTPGTDDSHLKADAYIQLRSSFIKTLSDSVEDLLKNSGTTIKHINSLLNERNQAHISNILGHLEQTLQHSDALTEQLRGGLQGLPQLTNEMTATFAQTSQVLEDAGQILQKLNRQEGLVENLTRGSLEITDALPGLKEASMAITQSSRTLNQLLRSLETHPQSLMFGKPSSLPGPGEPGFSPPRQAEQ